MFVLGIPVKKVVVTPSQKEEPAKWPYLPLRGGMIKNK